MAMQWPESLGGEVAASGLGTRCARGGECVANRGNYCIEGSLCVWEVVSCLPEVDGQGRTDMAAFLARGRLVLAALLFGLSLGSVANRPALADFAVHDGDTVVFLGDSITAARTYGKIVENYTLLRFPDRKVHFHNAGWGGDTAAGGLKRLERDVFAQKASVLIVAYGVNDIGWGARADEAHKKLYLDSIRGIVEQCKARGVRVFICSAAITAEDPDRSEHGFLQAMCDEGMAIARSLGEHGHRRPAHHAEDPAHGARRPTPQAKPQDKQTLHAADGIHLNDLGQLAMAFAILKGLGAPADVSAVSIDAAGPRVVAAAGCRVSNLSGNASRLEFDRLDDGLPINFGLFGGPAVPLRADPRGTEPVHAHREEPSQGPI